MMFAVINMISAIAKSRREYGRTGARSSGERTQRQPISNLRPEQLRHICGADDGGVPGPHGTWGLPPSVI